MSKLLLAVLMSAGLAAAADAQSRQSQPRAHRVGASRVNPPRAAVQQPAAPASAAGQTVVSSSPQQSRSQAAARRAMGGGGYTYGRQTAVSAAQAAESSQARPSSGGAAFANHRGWAPSGKLNRLRRADGDGSSAPADGGSGGGTGGSTTPAEEDNGNTWRNTPGALIRSEGMGFTWTQPAAPERLHTIESGNRVTYEESKGQNLTNHQGLMIGAKDTPPPPGGAFTGSVASGRNAITER